MDRYSYSAFVAMLNQFVDLVKSHSAITTFTGRRMNMIMLMLEAESLLEGMGEYYKSWKYAFPLNVQIDALQKLERQLDPENSEGIFKQFTDNIYDDSLLDHACTYRYHSEGEDENIQKQYSDKNSIPRYTQVRFKNLSHYFPVRFPSMKDRACRARAFSKDSNVFDKLFAYKPADLFSPYESLDASFTDEGKEKIQDFRQFLFMIDYSDLVDILKLEFISVRELLKSVVRVIEDPSDKICENLYSNAESLYDDTFPEHAAERERWRRYNSKKKDYINRLRLQKDEVRKQVTELGWDPEWEELFEYEGTHDVQPDNLAIGNLIHYHLDVMQKDDNKNLMLLIKLINDWLFYTWEEMKLLEPDEIPGAVVLPLADAEQTAVIADIHFEVMKDKEKKVAPAIGTPTIIVNGDLVAKKESNIDNNYGTVVDNHDGGKVLQPETKKLTE